MAQNNMPLPPMPAPGDISAMAVLARILIAAKRHGLSDRGLSLLIKKGDSYVRALRRAPHIPKLEDLKKLCCILEVDQDWLLNGIGDGLVTNERQTSQDNDHPEPTETTALFFDGNQHDDVPIIGTAAGSLAGVFSFEAGAIDRVAKPPGLRGARDLYGLYVVGDSMVPEHRHGDLRFVHPHRPVQTGDTVIVQVRERQDDKIKCFIKTLRSLNTEWVELEQWHPSATLKLARRTVVAIHKVLTQNELFGV